MPALMVPDARTLFERANGRRVLVVGDLMIDEWIWGTVTRDLARGTRSGRRRSGSLVYARRGR